MYIDGEMPGPVMQERLSAIVNSNEKEPTAPFIGSSAEFMGRFQDMGT